jgi:hypothetical protein
MKREEQIAETYLKSLGFMDVVFEQEGNIPPDFSLDGTVAVEVRRLNQHSYGEKKVRGLEEARIPLFGLLESCLSEFDKLYNGRSYWVSVRFHRPIGKSSSNRRAILETLSVFLNETAQIPCDIKVTESIYLHIFESQTVEGRVFRFAGGTDRESGGWVLPEFAKNFKYCVEEKTQKIKAYRNKYSTWWLILLDQIAHGFEENEKEEVKAMISTSSSWDKVIVLDSLSGSRVLEI